MLKGDRERKRKGGKDRNSQREKGRKIQTEKIERKREMEEWKVKDMLKINLRQTETE